MVVLDSGGVRHEHLFAPIVPGILQASLHSMLRIGWREGNGASAMLLQHDANLVLSRLIAYSTTYVLFYQIILYCEAILD